jgi:hypothetical protein
LMKVLTWQVTITTLLELNDNDLRSIVGQNNSEV